MQFIHLDTIDSTQLEVKRWLSKNPDATWTAIVADNQTHGKGQWGRHWVSVIGNLHVTYIIPLPANSKMGLRMVEIVHHVLPDQPIQIKWPNDIFVHGQKCGGVLCEAWGDHHTLIGLGLNTAHAPKNFGCLNLSTPPMFWAEEIGQHLQNWDMTHDRPWALPPLLYQNQWIDYTAPNGEVFDIYVEGLSEDGLLKARGRNDEVMTFHSGRLGIEGTCT